MARKGYNKAWCPQCNQRMLRARIFAICKGWGCIHCGYFTTGKASELKRVA